MSRFTETPFGRRIALVILGIAFVATASAIIAYPALTPSSDLSLSVGQVAPTDILAPRSITYDSDVLTRLSRQAASDAIRDVYDPPNPSVSRQQIQLAQHVLDYINNVRHDAYAAQDQQMADLAAITTLHLTPDTEQKLLNISDDTWKDISDQVMGVIERTMRGEVREDNLKEIYASLPNLIAIFTDEWETNLITDLAKDLIKPNTFYNDERTREARRVASAVITSETRSFAQGQIVVRAGSIVTDADMEALTQLKLLHPPDRRTQTLIGALLSVILFSTLGTIYLHRLHTDLFHDVPRMVLIGGLLLVFIAGARAFGTASEFQSYLYPAAAFSVLMVVLAGPQVAIVLGVLLAAIIGLVLGTSLEFAVLVSVGCMSAALSLNRTERLNAYFRAGLIISVANMGVGLLFMLFQSSVEPLRVVTILTAGMLNGIITAGLSIVGLYLISVVLNMPINVRLIELSQPNQPLLQRLLREAPGTYQHSLQVANLAELAAERIGANAPLTRVAALYHDIGKIIYPHFFVENQAEGVNPHDELNNPEQSARIIIGHVLEGERLARKYHLPSMFIDFILQHHGTTPVMYFYNQALKAVNCDETRVNKALFQYPGPRPQTREAAILMLADASESIVRAKRPQTKQAIEDIIRDIIEARAADGQLDASQLTLHDLQIIRDVFVTTLQGVFHPRIPYPALGLPEAPKAAELPASASSAATPSARLSASNEGLS